MPAKDNWKRRFHSHFNKVKGNVMRHPTIIIGVIAARGGNLERNPLPPTVKAVQVSALMRMRKSPKVEPKRKRESEKTPFEITRKTPSETKDNPSDLS